jgi:hypothetical protein
MPFSRTLAALLTAAALTLGFTAPASAQYGGAGVSVFVSPARLPVDQTFDVFGQNCAAGATVEITIDGVAGVLATEVADAGGFYAVNDIVLPDGLLAGTDQTVRATCGPETGTAVLTLVCHSGDDPVDGSCEDGSAGVVGGPGPTTTTTVPGGGTSGSGTGSNTGSTDGQSLAITGASHAQFFVQLAVTLLGLGVFLVVITKRRRDAAPT